MDKSLLDTDILSEVLKRKNLAVLAKARQYLAEHERLAFSAVTAYEIIRGLLAKNASDQLARFLKTLDTCDVYFFDLPVLMRAAELWADARAGGHPHDDADLMIGASALVQGRVLVTGNTDHFAWISGLHLEDWRLP
jgi:tRNA(fMet)-specific endonuclease VapC